MNRKEFKKWREKLSKTQKGIAQLLGISMKAVHSYEQGWRNIPAHVERQMLFLLSRINGNPKGRKPCWVIKKCPTKIKELCPAWEFQSGDLCWFINGTICNGTVHKNWEKKIKLCRSCEVLQPVLNV